jgi:hypothetical protein
VAISVYKNKAVNSQKFGLLLINYKTGQTLGLFLLIRLERVNTQFLYLLGVTRI